MRLRYFLGQKIKKNPPQKKKNGEYMPKDTEVNLKRSSLWKCDVKIILMGYTPLYKELISLY